MPAFGAKILLALILSFATLTNAQESLADLESFKSGCQALSDGRYETASSQFQSTWELLQNSGAGDLERNFVASRLLEALVRNEETRRATQWIDENPILAHSPETLLWSGLAYQAEERHTEAAEALTNLVASTEQYDDVATRYLVNSMALSGNAVEALEIAREKITPDSFSNCLDLSRTAQLAQESALSLEFLNKAGEFESSDFNQQLLATRLKAGCLLELDRIPAATTAVCDLIETASTPAEVRLSFLLLDEVAKSTLSKRLQNRLNQWIKNESHPVSETAAFYSKILSATSEELPEILAEVAEETPPGPFAHEAKLRLMTLFPELADLLPELTDQPELPGEPDRSSYLSGSLSYRQKKFEQAAAQFLDQLSKQAPENQIRGNYNSAISALQGNDIEAFTSISNSLRIANPRSPLLANLSYLGGLYLASQGAPEALEYLQTYIRENPNHRSNIEARLALSEIQLNQVPARPQAAREILDDLRPQPLTLKQSERLDYTAIWAEQIDENGTYLVDLAKSFLSNWPQSTYLPEIAMILGSQYQSDQKLEEARETFRIVGIRFPTSPYAEAAQFFSTQAAPRNQATLDEWRAIASSDSQYAAEAHHELCLLLLSLEEFEEARTELSLLLAKQPEDSNLRFALIADLAFSYYLESIARDHDKERLEKAANTFDRLSEDVSAPAEWRYNAAVRRAKCLESLGQPDAALTIYRTLVEEDSNPDNLLRNDVSPEENSWIFRAGFAAIELLQAKEDWQGAIQIADTLSLQEGPRAIEAARLSEKLRLKHWIWD